MATTPPPPSTLRIPPTPRHGAGYDQYSPYATRHSARLASQRPVRESRVTPPPSFPDLHHLASPRTGAKERGSRAEALSPPGSAWSSPRKKTTGRLGAAVPPYSLLGACTSDMDLSDPFDNTAAKQQQRLHHPSHTTTMTDGMLPTPAKTPKKKVVGDIGGTARTLFPPNPMSGRTKRSKKHTGFSLDSFTEDASGNKTKIEIYTDSRDRIPELDESESNPFYTKVTESQPAPPPTSTRTSRRLKTAGGKRSKEVDDAIKREDGMVYVFRGKKTFRRFIDAVESDGDDDGDDDDDLGLFASRPDLLEPSLTNNVRPLTRSSIKPRVLFPSAHAPPTSQETHSSDADEEAATDIEDVAALKTDAPEPSHPVEAKQHEQLTTPSVAPPADTPSSPGATLRSLRSRAKRDGVEHDATTPSGAEVSKKRVSPFDGWLRKKQVPTTTGVKTKKRDAEAVDSPAGPAIKKSRVTRATATSSQ
ncbi:hypothetical protein ASPZODRAFT_55271 [Penicilliopsis zonata CBS 506.65]|uniref:Uncharacterized protein n=1 Tax=Penicilliopsis zonata CBS 506.65 TaxID=1073090 RepID=A0A1L9SWD6_9EURO|nr:hypothetical protein ASPZODRAFT_55271 [Penicilliopsis zonata CBS 506.65]OJJ51489.1 hypothetical protein ASPZODRAFT_55271 [Penicilliopsis zonata CBS 506.65]